MGRQLNQYGALSINIDASQLQFYRSGVVGPSSGCQSDALKINHAVNLEGLGTDKASGKRYWSMKATAGERHIMLHPFSTFSSPIAPSHLLSLFRSLFSLLQDRSQLVGHVSDTLSLAQTCCLGVLDEPPYLVITLFTLVRSLRCLCLSPRSALLSSAAQSLGRVRPLSSRVRQEHVRRYEQHKAQRAIHTSARALSDAHELAPLSLSSRLAVATWAVRVTV